MKLTVLIPAYNEQARIAKTLTNLDNYLQQQPYDYQIVIVVNGSNDQTYQIVKELSESSVKKAMAIDLAQPGKGNAVKQGVLQFTEGDIVVFTDADSATPITEIEKFLPYFEQGYDVVIGSRELEPELLKVKQSLKRQILGKMSHWLIRLVLLPGIYDSQLGFKAFKVPVAKDIFQYVSIMGWAFDMEVLAIARTRGYKIKEVGVEWSEFGGTHVPMSAFAQSLIDLFRIKFWALSGRYDKK